MLLFVAGISCSDDDYLFESGKPNEKNSLIEVQGFSPSSTPVPTWGSTHSALSNNLFNNLGPNVGVVLDEFYRSFNYVDLGMFTQDQVIRLNQDFNFPGLDMANFAADIAMQAAAFQDNGSAYNLALDVPGLTNFYSASQLNIINRYLNSIKTVTGSTSHWSLWMIYDRVRTDLDAAGMSGDERIEVTAVVEMMHNFVKQYWGMNGGATYSTIITTLASRTGQSASGCTIRFRDVFRAAVLSGFGGAIAGGIAGATVGSFAVPLLGTVTGAVNGAVFGFASGFVSGAVVSMSEQIFWGCLMNSPYVAPSKGCEDQQFRERNEEYCSKPSTERPRKLWFLGNYY